MNANDLILIFFVREHPEIWQGEFKYQSKVDDAWNLVCQLVHDRAPPRFVRKLKDSWDIISEDYRNGSSCYRKFLGFIDNKPWRIIKPTDLEVSLYGDEVGYDKALFGKDNSTAMYALARMKRLYEDRQSGKSTGEIVDADEDGPMKWRRMNNGKNQDQPQKDNNAKDAQKNKNRFEREDRFKNEENRYHPKANRFKANRQREFHNRGAGGFGATDSFHAPFGGFGGGYDRYPEKRGYRFERRNASGFGAYDANYRSFGTGTSSFSGNRFEDSKTYRGFGREDTQSAHGFGRDDGKPSRGFGNSKPSRGFGDNSPSRGFGNTQSARGFGRDDGKPSRGFGDTSPSRGFGNTESARGFGRDAGKSSRGFGDTSPSRGFGNTESARGFGCDDGKSSRGFGNTEPSRGFGGTSSSRGFGRDNIKHGFGASEPSRGFERDYDGFGDQPHRPFGQRSEYQEDSSNFGRRSKKYFDDADDFNSRLVRTLDSGDFDYKNNFRGFCGSENGTIHQFYFPKPGKETKENTGFGCGESSDSEDSDFGAAGEIQELTDRLQKENKDHLRKMQRRIDAEKLRRDHDLEDELRKRAAAHDPAIRDDMRNYSEFYDGGEHKNRFFKASPKKTVKAAEDGKKKQDKMKTPKFEENRTTRFQAPRRPRRLSDSNMFTDDFDSASEGEPYFNSNLQEFSDEEAYRISAKKASATLTGTVIERKIPKNAPDSKPKDMKHQKKAEAKKPTEKPRYPTHTQFGDFNVTSEELADAITWLNEPANQLTIKQVKTNRSGRSDDIERLILKKLDLQSKYIMDWYNKLPHQSCNSLSELKFLHKKGIPVTLDASLVEQNPEVAASLLVAQTLYGPVQTNNIEEAVAITFLSDPDNVYEILNMRKEACSYVTSCCIEEKRKIETEFIKWWKLNKLGKPVNTLVISEMKWIISKKHGFGGFDEMTQIIQAEDFEQKEKYAREAPVGEGFMVMAKQGYFRVADANTAIALNWIIKKPHKCQEAKERLALGSLGAMDLIIKSFLDLQTQFVEDYENDRLDEQFTVSNLRRYCEKYEEKRLEEECKAEEEKYKNMAGAPADPTERNVTLAILEEELDKRRNWAGIWAFAGNESLRINNNEHAQAIQWLNNPDNAATLAEVKRKLKNKMKLGDIDQNIVDKMQHEKNFVRHFRRNRTDFELSVLSPKELKFVQQKEKEYQTAKAEKKKRPESSTVQHAAAEQSVLSICEVFESTNTTGPEKESVTRDSDVFEPVVHEGLETQSNDTSVRFVNTPQPLLTMDMFTPMKPKLVLPEVAPLKETETIEIGVEQVAEELNEEGFEPTNPSPSTSSYDMIPGTGTRTQQLTRMMADLLSEMERSNPAEYQAKEEAILRMLGN